MAEAEAEGGKKRPLTEKSTKASMKADKEWGRLAQVGTSIDLV